MDLRDSEVKNTTDKNTFHRRLYFQRNSRNSSQGLLEEIYLNYSGGASHNSTLWKGHIIESKDENGNNHYILFHQYFIRTKDKKTGRSQLPLTFHNLNPALTSLEKKAETAALEISRTLKLELPYLEKISKIF